MKKSLFIFMIFFPLFLVATVVPGGDVSGVWDIAGNPYYIDGEITIQFGEELEIEPGVDVIFNDHYKFIILGRLIANGTENDSINFSPLDNNLGWHGLRFIDGNLSSLPPSELSYSNFMRGYALGTDQDKNGGAIYCSNSANLSIENCYFEFNYAEWDGGGIHLTTNSDVQINNCNFQQNDCGFYGGAIISYSSSPIIDGCTFQNNSSSIFGAGFSSWDNSQPEIYNSRFIDNQAGACTGIYCVDSIVKMANVIMHGNITDFGSGAAIGLTSCNTEATNLTVVDNESPLSGGAFWINSGNLQLHNSILWNNLPEDIFVLDGSAEIDHSCVSDGTTGNGVIHDDPQFVDYNNLDLHLTEISPCIDTGDSTVVTFNLPELDLDGNYRIIDGDLDGILQIDMGVYEFAPEIPTGFISGTVTDNEGNALENAEITAGAYTKYTDINGSYTMEVEVGDYSVSCYLAGYQIPDSLDITVVAGETTTADFVLELEVSVDDVLENHDMIKLQNFPNPFNPSTTISFNLITENTGNTKIIIYNLKGQKVKTLECIDCVDAASSQMTHSITWNGKDENNKSVSSGVYFYHLLVGNKKVASNRMLLIK